MVAPILITVYNRLEHFQKCINSLRKCEFASESTLYISSDAAFREEDEQIIEHIRQYSQQITGFKEVIPFFQNKNKGLAKCYYESIEKIFTKSETLIFLEDDIIVSPNFLKFINAGLHFYKNDLNVLSVSGFSHSVFFDKENIKENEVYFTNRWNPWGFGIWRNKFLSIPNYTLIDLKRDLSDEYFVKKLNTIGMDLYPAFKRIVHNNKMLSLDFFYIYHMIKMNLVTVTPYSTKTFNIGNDGSGTRTKASSRYSTFNCKILEETVDSRFVPFSENEIVNKFNEQINRNKTSKIKHFLIKVGLLNVAFYIHEKRKKWGK